MLIGIIGVGIAAEILDHLSEREPRLLIGRRAAHEQVEQQGGLAELAAVDHTADDVERRGRGGPRVQSAVTSSC